MKSISVCYLALVLFNAIFLLTACSKAQDSSQGSYESLFGNTTSQRASKEPIELKPSIGTDGVLYGHYPMPKSWKMSPKGITGPHHLKVEFIGTTTNNGRATPIDQLIKNKISGLLRKEGLKITGVHKLPEVADQHVRYSKMLYSVGGQRVYGESRGVDLAGSDGKRSYLLLTQTILKGQFGTNWSMEMIGLESNASYLDEAKKALIFALVNFKPNQAQIAAYNQREQAKEAAGWRQFNRRSAARQRAWERSNRAIVDANNATNDIIMNTYRSSTAAFDRANQSIVNGIRDESTMFNTQTGQNIQVENGYDHYYSNSFNEYYGTDDAFHQPVDGYNELLPDKK